MALLHDAVLDAALNVIVSNGSRLDICSSEPATYGGIAGVSLGNKTALSIGSPADRAGGGREIQVNAITGGSCTAGGNATHFAIHNATAAIYATGSLSTTYAVVNGATFSLAAFKIGIPDPA
jgi:hypothetical protein